MNNTQKIVNSVVCFIFHTNQQKQNLNNNLCHYNKILIIIIQNCMLLTGGVVIFMHEFLLVFQPASTNDCPKVGETWLVPLYLLTASCWLIQN